MEVQSRNNALMTDTRQSMEMDGFNQAEYNQLVSDVRSGLPPAIPKLLVTLRVPRNKRTRDTRASRGPRDDYQTFALYRAASRRENEIIQRRLPSSALVHCITPNTILKSAKKRQ